MPEDRQCAEAQVKSLTALALYLGLRPQVDLETDLTVFSMRDLLLLRRAVLEVLYSSCDSNEEE